jgi:hypothetical protein
VGFKTGIDKIDLSGLHVTGANLGIFAAGTSNTLYIEMNPGTFTVGILNRRQTHWLIIGGGSMPAPNVGKPDFRDVARPAAL